MKPIDLSFFEGKRPWSQIKDRVLGAYLPPYLHKTCRLQRPIVIVDCFAGRGAFSDGTPGSPLIICQQIKKHAHNGAIAYFVNKRPAHHEALSRTLRGFIETGIARPVLGQGERFLTDLTANLRDETVFVYLDPFGIKGCNFTATQRLLQRSPSTSTEMLMTLSMPVLHRLAAKDGAHGIIPRFHEVLDAALGEVAWRDIMLNAYQDHTFTQERGRLPLFEPVMEDWRATRTNEQEEIARIITCIVQDEDGITRAELWQKIVIKHFMCYREAEFRNAVQALVNKGSIVAEQPVQRRLNDHSILRPAPKRAPGSETNELLSRRSS